MLTHRYIQAVLARDLADDAKPSADAATVSAADLGERTARADEHRQRAEQLSLRLVDLDRRFGI